MIVRDIWNFFRQVRNQISVVFVVEVCHKAANSNLICTTRVVN